MPKVRSADQIAQKWAEVTPARAGEYTKGVESPREDWQAATRAAAPNYTTAVTQAASQGRFAAGVGKSSTEKWRRGAVQKGASRFGAGVALAQPDFQEGFEPYRRVIETTTIPPRKPKGDPSNIQRVATLAAALNLQRIGKRG